MSLRHLPRHLAFLSAAFIGLFWVNGLRAQLNYATPYTFTTLAGTAGIEGSTDGTGSAARFSYPGGVAIDANRNLYVADSNNHTVRKITNTGIVTTLAGSAGNYGGADGTGTDARFSFPQGIAVDANGTVYVSDMNNTIRKITPEGVVTTLAGVAGEVGNVDGAGTDARFTSPTGLAVNDLGIIYVADTGNHSIRKITSDGMVTTLATGLDYPTSVAVDANGTVYVTDSDRIRKVTSEGLVTTLAGADQHISGDFRVDGAGDVAEFYGPWGIAVGANGDVYVSDNGSSLIRKVTSAGVVTTLAGDRYASADGKGLLAAFYYPMGIAIDDSGTLYVADSANFTIRKGVLDMSTIKVGGRFSFDARKELGLADGVTATFYAKGLPAGLALDATTGQITGVIKAKPGKYSISYWSKSGGVTSAVKSLVVTVGAFPAAITGKYEALLAEVYQIPIGKVELLVGAAGTFTGKLTCGDATVYAFKGSMILNGAEDSSSVSLAVGGYTLDLTVTASGGFSVVLSSAGLEMVSTTAGIKLANTGHAGTYTLLLTGAGLDDSSPTPPKGDGYATVTINSKGLLSLKGKLADGTPLTGSLSSGVDDMYRLYRKLPYRRGGGCLTGELTMQQRTDNAALYHLSDYGYVYWYKPVVTGDALYPEGFGPVSLIVRMEPWRTQSGLSLRYFLGLQWDWPWSGSCAASLAADDMTNTTYGVARGGYSDVSPVELMLNDYNKVMVVSDNPTGWKASLNVKTGAFSGSFTLSDLSGTRKVSFAGLLIQPPASDSSNLLGAGYFLLPPSIKGGATHSGSVEFFIH